MRYRVLGGTGIEVSHHCLGAMMFGSVANNDHEEGVRIIHRALDEGINFVDTADMYSVGDSEVIVGKAVKGRRDDVVLATKFHFPLGEGRNRGGNSRRYVVRAVEDSLRRLGTDWIDVYQVHRPDPRTDVEETLSVLTDLVRQGKIRAFGSSTFGAEELVEADRVARDRGLMRFRTEQPPYSLLARGVERSVLPTARRLGMGVLVWSPLASGFLSGKHRRGGVAEAFRATLTPERFDESLPGNTAKFDAVEQFAELAGEMGVSLPALAVAFVTTHPAVTSAITGPRTMEHLESLLEGASLVLTDDVLDRVDEIVPPGVDTYDVSGGWKPASLVDVHQRRRPLDQR
ncbi:aldo/keto reductase [Lentzea sp. DG1S-22]|uniref:aldo/keto reductase n=1 Tax=Lentzea sp. DG1S-22 TaxID=3108822 RepID=UPI003FA5693F